MAITYNDRRIVRTIYYKLLAELVKYGHNVDDRLYPDTQVGIANYEAAIKALKTSGKLIEITSESSRRNRGKVTAPEFNIDLTNVLVGDIGAEPNSILEKPDGTYYQGALPGQASNLIVEIYATSSTSDQFYLLNNLLYNAFGKRKYLALHDDPTSHFFIEQTVMERIDDYDENVKDMRVVYHVPDVYLGEIQVLRDNIVPIKEIKADIGTGLTDLTVTSEP